MGTESQWLELKQRLEVLESQKVELSQLEELRAATDRRLRLLEARLKTGGAPEEPEQAGNAVVVTPVEEPVVEPKVTDLDDDPREYHVEESTWDAVLVTGNMTKVGETFMIVTGCMLNLAIQILYCVIVNKTLAQATIDENKLKHLAIWRMVIGHKADHYDTLTQTSLVGRVCDDAGFSITSASQQNLYKELNDYQMSDGANLLASPPVLCIISMFCWIMIAVGDFVRTTDLARALASMPRAKMTHMVEMADGSLRLEAMGRGRLIFVVFGVVIPKIGIVLAIGFLGIKYLVYTKKAEDLLLNAIALQFILEVDELLFQRFMPLRVKEILTRVKPLPISDRLRMPRCCRRKFPFRQASVLVLAGGILAVVISQMLLHEINLTREGLRIMCSGNKDFFYATDTATGAITISEGLTAKLNSSDVQYLFDSYPFRAVLQETGLARVDTLKDVREPGTTELVLRGTDAAVSELNKFTSQQATDQLPCHDLLQDQLAYLEAFQYLNPGADFINGIGCQAFDAYSCTPDQPFLRSFCPVSCGCDRYDTGLFNRVGCSSQCERLANTVFEADTGNARRSERNNGDPCADSYDFSDAIKLYFGQVQDLLIEEEALVVNNSLGEGFVQMALWTLEEMAWSSDFEYYIPLDLNVDLAGWAEESYKNASAAYEDVKCNIVPFIYRVFGLDLCNMATSTIFEGRVGAISAICIKTCGQCTEPESTPYKVTNWTELESWSYSALADHPLKYVDWEAGDNQECDVWNPIMPGTISHCR